MAWASINFSTCLKFISTFSTLPHQPLLHPKIDMTGDQQVVLLRVFSKVFQIDILGKLLKVEEKVRDIEASLAEQLRKIIDMFKHITKTTKGKNGRRKLNSTFQMLLFLKK